MPRDRRRSEAVGRPRRRARTARTARQNAWAAESPDSSTRARSRRAAGKRAGGRRGRATEGGGRGGGALRVVVAVAAVLVAFGIVASGVYSVVVHPPENNAVAAGVPVHVVIEPGSSTAAIAEELEALGVVDSALAFRLHARLAEADGRIKAGEYDLATGMPLEIVLERLVAGPKIVAYDVTIPEGFTAKQVARRFAEQAGIPEAELMALVTTGAEEFAAEHPYLKGAFGGSLEGYLFPATYTVKKGATARDVVEMMLDHFDDQAATLDLSYAESRGLGLREVVTIASILEREAQLPEEFPLVSSVIYNRLARPMRLQLCATVLYTLPEGTTKLTNADLKTDSPYNTYLHDGLPPGPISNPGLAALQAAARPAKTDYYYYVLTGKDGSQTFTKTYDEFLAAKAQARRVFGD